MGDLYAPFVRQGTPVIYMDEKSAELTKYAANSFLATKISFMNEIARLCELMGADVDMVRRPAFAHVHVPAESWARFIVVIERAVELLV